MVVAALDTLVRLGLERVLEPAGPAGGGAGGLRTSGDPAEVEQWLRAGTVGLLLADPGMLARLDPAVLAGAAPRMALVAGSDHLPADLPVARRRLCTMLGSRVDPGRLAATLEQLRACTHALAHEPACECCPLRASLQPQPLPLSPREQEVFEAIGAGLGTSDIARRSGLSVKTIEGYRERIKLKLGLEGREALSRAALRWRQGFHLALPPGG